MYDAVTVSDSTHQAGPTEFHTARSGSSRAGRTHTHTHTHTHTRVHITQSFFTVRRTLQARDRDVCPHLTINVSDI